MIEGMVRRVTSPVLVGRSDVVGRLESAVKASSEGRPHHAVIGGEAGVGKTRLLTEAGVRATAMGARVVLGGCVSIGAEGLPFAPYTQIIRTLVAEDGASAVIAAAGRAAPDLARLVPALDTGEAAPAQELWAQARLYEALLDLFRRLAGRSPLVLQIEDLHWADPGTLAATSYLLRAIEDEPISVMATFRADELTRRHPVRPWLAEVVRDANVERIELEPLGQTDVRSLIGNILGEQPKDREVEEIQLRADGNPFFVEELLCCRDDYDESMPASLRDVLLSRIDALPDSSQRLMGMAAVGGREVEHEMLVAVAGHDDTATELRVLVDEGLLVPTSAIDGDDAYSFRHALLREAVYDEMLPSERRRLHASWGEYLSGHEMQADDTARLVQLAHHWREARDERALDACIAAGDAAMSAFSYATAMNEFAEALALWEDGLSARDDLDHVDLLERASRSANLANEDRRAVAWSKEAVDEVGDADPARRTVLLILQARTFWVSGHWGSSITAYERALETAPSEPPVVRVQALSGLAQVYMLHARFREARPMCESAIEAAVEIGRRDLEGHARNTYGVVLAGLGEIDRAVEEERAALEIALELGIPDDIGRAYVNRAEIDSWEGYPERALETSFEGIEVSADWGVANSYGAYLAFGAVSFAFEAGRWDQAADLLAQRARIAGFAEGAWVYRSSYVMELFACRGDEDFWPFWERARRLMLERPPSDNHGLLFLGGIEGAAFADDHERALGYAWEVIDLLHDRDAGVRLVDVARVASWPQAELGKAARLQGDDAALAEARAGMDRLLALSTSALGDLPHRDGRLATVVGLSNDQVRAEQSRMEGTATHDEWARIADEWTEIGRPFRSAMARWRAAEVAADAGDRDDAVAALRQAHVIATELGARPLQDQLQALSRRMRARIGAKPASRAPDRAYGLTRREAEVLSEVAAGRTNREIAEKLFISESTAGVHVSNILGKLGVSTRTEAARVALDQGLVEGAR
jgi:DNA-binding CsgD family transcriptional regulator